MHEEILEVIETFGRKALCITPNSIIIARLRGVSFVGFLIVLYGLFGRLTSIFEKEMTDEKKEKLGKLSPEGILTADKKNFAIPYSDVTRLEMSKGFLGSKVKIMIGVNKHQFKLRNTNEYYKCMSALKTVLEDKLTVS